MVDNGRKSFSVDDMPLGSVVSGDGGLHSVATMVRVTNQLGQAYVVAHFDASRRAATHHRHIGCICLRLNDNGHPGSEP